MGRFTIYLDQKTERRLKAFLEEANVSKSSWIASLIRKNTAAEWPERVTRFTGAWKDFPKVDDLKGELVSDSHQKPLWGASWT